MVGSRCSPPRVVVGLDASRAALQAAMWAVDEAVHHQIPLRLLYAIDEHSPGSSDQEADFAAAERAVAKAISLIQDLESPIQVETEIMRCRAVTALLEASRSAAMVCVGSIGIRHIARGRIGTTWSALLASLPCPVAVVPRTRHPSTRGIEPVLAVVDNSSAADAVLELGVTEACLRSAPLHVFILRNLHRRTSGYATAPLDPHTVADIERRIDHWQATEPGLDIEVVSGHHDLLNYLEQLQRHATPLQLIVVDPRRPGPLDELLGVAARASLEAAGCTVLTCERREWL